MKRLAILLLLLAAHGLAHADSLTVFSEDFWQWRALEQPFSDDDIPRIERPAGMVVDWSPETVATRIHQLEQFEQR